MHTIGSTWCVRTIRKIIGQLSAWSTRTLCVYVCIFVFMCMFLCGRHNNFIQLDITIGALHTTNTYQIIGEKYSKDLSKLWRCDCEKPRSVSCMIFTWHVRLLALPLSCVVIKGSPACCCYLLSAAASRTCRRGQSTCLTFCNRCNPAA